MKHGREQVLDYFAALITAETDVLCEVHRIGLAEQRQSQHIEIYIDDEVSGGDDAEDSHESVLEATVRVSPMVVKITVKSADVKPDTLVNNLSAQVEKAIATEDGNGEHLIGDAPVDSQWAGMTREDEDNLEVEMSQIELIFETSYRTAIGDATTLV